MTSILYTKLSDNKGATRLFVEGHRLLHAGVEPGMRYRITLDPAEQRMTLTLDEQGDRVVSRRQRRGQLLPVLDINNQALGVVFAEVERVRIVIKADVIVVTVHHLERKEQVRFERLQTRLHNGRPLDVVSLAHGGGVMDYALHQGLLMAGVKTRLAAAIEIDGRYLDASLANNPIWDAESIAICAPMQEVEFRKLKSCDMLCAGLPCTGASLAGRAKNRLSKAEAHQSAGALFVAFLGAIQVLNPAVVILENVPAYQQTASMMVIRSVLSALGYVVHETVLNGNVMGALEDRDRLCMVAVSSPVAIDLTQIKPIRTKEAQLMDVMETLPDDSPRWKSYRYLADKAVRDLEAGKGFKRQLLTGREARCGTIGRGYQKARSTEPFLVHPRSRLQRLLTPREHARVKTIPPELVQGLSDTVAHEVLGQSVIYCAFVALGRLLGSALMGVTEQKQACA